ncbi:MAG: glycosyltransferase family 2 protein [Bacilli bacterium]|jgi:glycosyltransferase involved in cell wall biosynthesis|nr:glycosyltransferase family 2 protein [Bacilli bacterium]MDY0064083.1 glycosyltransferase family 2 protein [Bacilli bacterium]
MKKITIIVPCYNEQEVLPLFFEEIQKQFNPTYLFQLVFVDDGSKDQTLSIIRDYAKQYSFVKYISFSRNFGKESAMLAGLKAAKDLNSDAAIIIDADLQHPPVLIKEMITYFEEGYKHIYARQNNREKESFIRTFFALAFYRVYAFFTGFKNMNQGAVDFCLIDRDVIDAFLEIKDVNRFTKGIFSWVGYEKKCLDFDHTPRAAGHTKWSFWGLWKYAFLGIKQFSRFYLFLFSLLLVIGFGFFAVDIILDISRQTFSYVSLKLDVFIILILLGLRTITKLLYDIRDQSLNRPIYLTKESNISHDTH